VSVHDLQAPEGDGQVLIHPSLDRVWDSLQFARQDAPSVVIAGKPLAQVRHSAREQVWEQIRSYYQASGEPFPMPTDGPWFVGGHQPELFHPGVWLKNFFLAGLARRFSGLSLNLIVDNDTARHPVLRIPGEGHVHKVPFDHWSNEVPFEEREVVDESLFARLPHSAAEVTASWPFRPLLLDFWIDVQAAAKCTKNLAERFVRARRAWERRWGSEPVELPVSRLCRTEAFATFASHLIANAADFRFAYNRAVEAYRTKYRLRSRNHPVPNLAAEGEWIELPFWGWRTGCSRRGRLFVRSGANAFELRSDAQVWPTLKPGSLIASLGELEGRGFKIRPRALSLTLFVRLCLADTFVHGLGGGKYDEVTDRIIADFFGLTPPLYMVATGTLRLPLERPDVTPDDQRRLAWRRRDLIHNPQRHIGAKIHLSPRDRDILMTKAVLMGHEPLRHRDRKDRFFQMRHINEDLQHLVEPQKETARDEKAAIDRRLEENAILARRDYAFCLYPEEQLRSFLRVGSHGEPGA